MNFCVAILILKMEENTHHFDILCYVISRKVKMQLKRRETRVCAVYGEGPVTDRTCQKWFAKFPAGDLSLDNASRSGRSIEIDSNQMETLIENNRHFATWERANILTIFKSIKLLVNMNNVLFYRKKTKQTFWPTQYIQPPQAAVVHA